MEALIAYLKRPLAPFVIALIIIVIITAIVLQTHHARSKPNALEQYRHEIQDYPGIIPQKDFPSGASKQP